MAVAYQPTTIEAFEAFTRRPENEGRRFELVNGEIIEKMPTIEHGDIAVVFVGAFLEYFKTHPVGRVVVEVRFRPPISAENDFIPDVAIIPIDAPRLKRGVPDYMPLLVVEVKSPDDTLRKMREKARQYIASGVKMVLLVISDKRVIEGYTSDDEYVLVDGDTLSGGDVLPGFEIDVAELWEG
jgi:Uma2 family endonuclease